MRKLSLRYSESLAQGQLPTNQVVLIPDEQAQVNSAGAKKEIKFLCSWNTHLLWQNLALSHITKILSFITNFGILV
jgi:hypothetical protein